jgi:fucose permease
VAARSSAAAPYALWAWLFVVLGLSLAVLGPALPALRDTFHASVGASGLIFALHSAGYFGGVLAAGPLSDTRGRRAVVAAGTAALAAGMGLAAVAPSWPVLLLTMVVAGLGFACIDVGLNAALGDAAGEAGRRAALMNLLHGAFPAGTLLGPVALGIALRLDLGWRTVFLATGVAAGVSLLALLAARRWPPPPRGQHMPDLAHVARLLREPALRKLAISQGLYVGVEVSLAGWITTYLLGRYGAPEAVAALATSAYWLGFLIGRPVVALATRHVAPQRLLPWMMAGGLAGGIAGVLAPSAPAAVAAYTLAGGALSGVFPTVMALALGGRQGDTGAVAALITGTAALGSLVWPWLVGAVAQATSLQVAMGTAAAPLAVVLALSMRLGRAAPTGGVHS